jgi:hypothetical protein
MLGHLKGKRSVLLKKTKCYPISRSGLLFLVLSPLMSVFRSTRHQEDKNKKCKKIKQNTFLRRLVASPVLRCLCHILKYGTVSVGM